jgi:hypothetical protein
MFSIKVPVVGRVVCFKKNLIWLNFVKLYSIKTLPRSSGRLLLPGGPPAVVFYTPLAAGLLEKISAEKATKWIDIPQKISLSLQRSN